MSDVDHVEAPRKAKAASLRISLSSNETTHLHLPHSETCSAGKDGYSLISSYIKVADRSGSMGHVDVDQKNIGKAVSQFKVSSIPWSRWNSPQISLRSLFPERNRPPGCLALGTIRARPIYAPCFNGFVENRIWYRRKPCWYGSWSCLCQTVYMAMRQTRARRTAHDYENKAGDTCQNGMRYASPMVNHAIQNFRLLSNASINVFRSLPTRFSTGSTLR
ncbi:hypothetical protein B0H66DRAFT_544343 [Apodospora peruviana]|uniref:Uncharacterized protein n=1 Tax=Apodospora peruviana TaxID=516989 RepID=A0AAE0ISV6_9PEZI|nr:hypothetical protein B0H66DRAFT_544343 [Apodospora peruviana]